MDLPINPTQGLASFSDAQVTQLLDALLVNLHSLSRITLARLIIVFLIVLMDAPLAQTDLLS